MNRVLRHDGGAAAAEMALVIPMLLILMFGAFELGNYFLSEHVLLKGVRDGAVYAARQDLLANYNCAAGPVTVPTAVVSDTKTLVRTGQLSGGTDRLPNWDDGSTIFTITANCVTSAGGTALSGMYASNGGQVPVITVDAQLPYESVLAAIGFNSTALRLNATEQAAATGL